MKFYYFYEMKLIHFIKIVALFLICLSFSVCNAENSVLFGKIKSNSSTISTKTHFTNEETPLKFDETPNFNDYNQIIIRQIHKPIQSFQIAWFNSNKQLHCIQFFNFFSGNNKHLHFISKKVLLFPFHAFW